MLLNPNLLMSEREIKNLLEDIYDAVIKISTYTKVMVYDDFIPRQTMNDSLSK